MLVSKDFINYLEFAFLMLISKSLISYFLGKCNNILFLIVPMNKKILVEQIQYYFILIFRNNLVIKFNFIWLKKT